MKHYSLLINGKKIETNRKDYIFRIEDIIKDSEEILSYHTRKIPKPLSYLLKYFPGMIKTKNLDLQYLVEKVKKNGYPRCSTKDIQKIIYGTYSIGSSKENKEAIESAKLAQKEFKKTTIDERIYIIEHFVDKLLKALPRLRKIADEMGFLTIFEGNFNFNVTATLNKSTLNFYKERLLKQPLTDYNYIRKDPYGVFGIALPYNDFLFDCVVPIVSAILSGNGAVVKMPRYPVILCEVMDLLQETFEKCNVPAGLINLVNGNSKKMINEWIHNPDLNGIVFYGGSEIGLNIGARAAKTATKMIYQLGGCDPVLVWKDVEDIDEAVEKVVIGRFSVSGQMCNAVKRVYVHKDIYDVFLDKVVAGVSKLQMAYPPRLDHEITDQIIIGSIKALNQLEEYTQDAVAKGAEIKLGGKRMNYLKERDNTGLFFEPTVLTNVNHQMKIMQDECFGPVLPIKSIESLEEAIELANGTRYGLRGSIWATDPEVIETFVSELYSGNVTVNEVNNFSYYFAPHQNGTRISGITGVRYFCEEMCFSKYVYQAPNYTD